VAVKRVSDGKIDTYLASTALSKEAEIYLGKL
jgi:hypothetical protein